MSIVTVEVDPKWVKFVRSLIFSIVAALQGVAVSFAPLFLYWSGKGESYSWLRVVYCAVVLRSHLSCPAGLLPTWRRGH